MSEELGRGARTSLKEEDPSMTQDKTPASANSALQNICVPGHYPVRHAISMLDSIVVAFLSAIDAFLAAGSKETALATIGTALAAVGAAFASFFSHETTAEGCETVGGSNVSSNPTIP